MNICCKQLRHVHNIQEQAVWELPAHICSPYICLFCTVYILTCLWKERYVDPEVAIQELVSSPYMVCATLMWWSVCVECVFVTTGWIVVLWLFIIYHAVYFQSLDNWQLHSYTLVFSFSLSHLLYFTWPNTFWGETSWFGILKFLWNRGKLTVVLVYCRHFVAFRWQYSADIFKASMHTYTDIHTCSHTYIAWYSMVISHTLLYWYQTAQLIGKNYSEQMPYTWNVYV